MVLSSAQATTEFGILCLVARKSQDFIQLANALKRDIDWNALLNLAAAHAVRPQLIQALLKLDWIGVPAETKLSLLNFLRLHKARSLFVAGELMRVSDELSQKGIPFATFKGPALAAGLYGDLSLREYNDIDLIVEWQQVARTESVLSSLGYQAVHGAVFRDAFLSYQRQFAFVREAPSLAIDLHWDFTASHIPFPISPAEIWSNLEEVDIGSRKVPTLGKNDLALFLAGHGAKEGWRCLSWVSDFAMFIEKHPGLDWDHFLVQAQRRGCGQSVLVGCQLAAQMLGARVKIDLNKFAGNKERCLFMTETVLHRVCSELPAASLDRELGDLELCENWLQKARAVGKLLITRTVSDYTSMPLPRSLWRIYHVTRPFRLAGKATVSYHRSNLLRSIG